MILPQTSQLAEVNDVFNGILVRGDAIGDVVFYGRGAGKLPTASAVVADIIDEVKHLGARKYLSWEPGEEGYVADYRNTPGAAMLRLKCENVQAVRDSLEQTLGACSRISVPDAPADELAVVTPAVEEYRIDEALAALTDAALISRLRIGDL
jgi:homoserine dehydrogenase